MKKSELPPDIEGIRETIEALIREELKHHTDGFYTLTCPIHYLAKHISPKLLSKLTEHGARIKIKGKWYGLDGTVKEKTQ